MDGNYEVTTFIWKYLYFKQAAAAKFVDTTKIGIVFIKKPLKG